MGAPRQPKKSGQEEGASMRIATQAPTTQMRAGVGVPIATLLDTVQLSVERILKIKMLRMVW